jgi:Ni,Fe-hydrogenase I large subunit
LQRSQRGMLDGRQPLDAKALQWRICGRTFIALAQPPP